MRFGPDDGPVVVVAPPLFEEANRTRALIVAVLRGLAGRGVAGALPDLPGQGESRAPIERTDLNDLTAAYAAAVRHCAAGERAVYGASVRSGALLDAASGLSGRWRLSPQDGPALQRELTRVKQAEVGAARRLSGAWWSEGDGRDVIRTTIAGNVMASGFLSGLTYRPIHDEPCTKRRTVRFATDPAPADLHLPGSPPWRRSEPEHEPLLSQALADDLADWLATCERR